MLRLTLRTLLAYLDDTLDPAQSKDMGRRVAESEFAQETVERIKSVTRRRRLAAPALDPADSRADPNTIAEYLDNTLTSEQVAELESTALKSDVLLAEIAASHQILTLVLGEPAKVPPTANRRMYTLVNGPEAVPNRKPNSKIPPVAGIAPPPPESTVTVPEDEFWGSLVGPKKFLWFGGVFLMLAGLVVAVWFAIPAPPEPSKSQGYVYVSPTQQTPVISLPKTPDTKPVVIEPKTQSGNDPKVNPPTVPPEPKIITEVIMPPMPKDASGERKPIGIFDSPTQPLLARKAESTKWELVKPDDSRLSSTDTLMALPGFHPTIKLDNGTEFKLHGNVPELLNVPVLESRVTFYQPPADFVADLSLHAGRIFVSCPTAKEPVKVRIRFLEEIWNITLADANTEIAIDRIGEPAKGPIFEPVVLESPRTLIYLGVLKGEVSVQVGLTNSGALATGTKYKWDSKGGRAAIAPANDPDEAALSDRWSLRVPNTTTAKEMELAIADWVRRATVAKTSLDAEIERAIRDPKEAPAQRALASTFLQATDNILPLIDGIRLDSSAVRDASVKSARHWCAQSADREKAFGAFLAEKKLFTDDQRALIQALLRGRDDAAPRTIEQLFTLLRHEELAVRELARFQLTQLDVGGTGDSGYEAAAEPTRRAEQIAKWQSTFKSK